MKIKAFYFQDVGPLRDQCIDLQNDWDDSIEARVLLSGPNGCGKSTVLRSVAMLWDALGHWLDHRTILPRGHAAREWLQRWGGCGVVLDGLQVANQPVGLMFGDLAWGETLREQHPDVAWLGESVARTGKPGNPKREVLFRMHPGYGNGRKRVKNDPVVRQGGNTERRVSRCRGAALGVAAPQCG